MKDLSVEKMLSLFREDPTRSNHYLTNYSEYGLRSMAASYVVHARKPSDLSKVEDDSSDNYKIAKRQYYSLRQEVLLRHHKFYYIKTCHTIKALLKILT